MQQSHTGTFAQHYFHFNIHPPPGLNRKKTVKMIKFRYSVKATKICPIFHLFDITKYVMSKGEWKMGQNLIDALLLNQI